METIKVKQINQRITMEIPADMSGEQLVKWKIKNKAELKVAKQKALSGEMTVFNITPNDAPMHLKDTVKSIAEKITRRSVLSVRKSNRQGEFGTRFTCTIQDRRHNMWVEIKEGINFVRFGYNNSGVVQEIPDITDIIKKPTLS